MKFHHLAILLICSLFFACSAADKETEALLQGRWAGDSWFIEDVLKSYDMSRIYFEFQDGNRYEARLGDSFEKGTFRVYGDKLYTQNGAAAQIVTNINKLTTDSLVINMNRGGQREQLILIRKTN
jgi:hypothetical protein